MSMHPIHPEANDNPGPHHADTQGYREVLNDLIHLGAGLARFLHGQAAHIAQQAAANPVQTNVQQITGAQHATNDQPAPASDALISLTLAFDRIARAVRRSILLARSLDHPVQPAPDPAQHRAATRRRIIRAVEDAIQRTGGGASDGCHGAEALDAPETLRAELRERLDAPDLDDDITTRPAADIIIEICRDLGLAAPPGGAPPWKRRTPGDIAQLCAAAAAPSITPQPSAHQPGAGPQTLRCDVAQPTPGPQPDPAASPRAQPGPIHAGSGPLEDPASLLATILRHPTRTPGRWRPPH